jgi:hypothetical protein
MADRTSRWTTGLATAVLMALPFLASAQTPTQQPQQEQPRHDQMQHRADDPEQHLQQARQALEQINKDDLDPQARAQFERLKEQFKQLERAYKGQEQDTTARAEAPAPRPDAPAGHERMERAEWTQYYAKVDSTLTEILGPQRDVVGTTGVEPEAEVRIDAQVKSQLEQFRHHLHLFNAAAEVRPGAAPGEPMTPADRTVTPSPAAPDTPATTPDRPATQPDVDRPDARPPHEPLTGGVTQPQAPAQRPGADQARQDDPEYHLERIRTLLDQAMRDPATPAVTPDPERPAPTTGVAEPGKVTVDRSTLEQIRNHVQQLERIVKDRDRDRQYR